MIFQGVNVGKFEKINPYLVFFSTDFTNLH